MATKQKSEREAQALELLKTGLPRAVSDPKLAEEIFAACEQEFKAKNRVVSFEKFWESKTGQKLMRDRVEKGFPKFMIRAPGKMLAEAGLRWHYKEPEPVKQLRPTRSGPKQLCSAKHSGNGDR